MSFRRWFWWLDDEGGGAPVEPHLLPNRYCATVRGLVVMRSARSLAPARIVEAQQATRTVRAVC